MSKTKVTITSGGVSGGKFQMSTLTMKMEGKV